MALFKIIETPGFLDDLTQDFGGQQKQIKEKLTNFVYPQLENQPYFGPNIKKLHDYHSPTWRYRIGNYRFFYEIDGKTNRVIMIAARHRQEAY